MYININHEQVGPFKLVGGSPAGSFLGQLCYTTGCHDNTYHVYISQDNKYQYIDDLNLLELIFMTDLPIEYDLSTHVVIDQWFLPPNTTQTQVYDDGIAQWTRENLTRLNTTKSSYMVHTQIRESSNEVHI